MNIYSIFKNTFFDKLIDLYDLITPSFIYRNESPDIQYTYVEVKEYQEMRIDLIFMEAYNLNYDYSKSYLQHIDVILYLNNIDNPLNIKKGMTLMFPPLEKMEEFRTTPDTLNDSNLVQEKLSVPNKSTRKDKNREDFKNNGYSLPPVVLDKPKVSVSIKNGKYNIGGL